MLTLFILKLREYLIYICMKLGLYLNITLISRLSSKYQTDNFFFEISSPSHCLPTPFYIFDIFPINLPMQIYNS